MLEYDIIEIAEIINGKLEGDGESTISSLLIDSRTIVSAESSLFFAVVGLYHNGHQFIGDLYEKGVRNFVVSSLPKRKDEFENSNFIVVQNTRIALQTLTSFHRKRFDIPVVGITGSNGKTIIKEWLYQLLHDDKNIIRNPKSYNSQIGVPLSVWQLNSDYNFAIFEAGISQIDEMGKLQKIIDPTLGIFTNIGDAHQQNFLDYKHKINEKLKLFHNVEKLIYCKDYPLLEMQIQSNYTIDETKLLCWSSHYPADLFISSIRKNLSETLITGQFKGEQIKITIPFIDQASIENAIHCWLLMLHLGYKNDLIKERMMGLSSVAMRLELKQGINNCTIINDSYNSDIGSLKIALDFLNQQQQHEKKTLIISDILQSGRNEISLYKDVSELVRKKQINQLIGIGEAISGYASLFLIKSHFYKSTSDFLDNISIENFQNEAILLKGSRVFEFERISNALQQKLHRTVLEINLSSIVHNLNLFRSKIKKDTKIMVMVKAFSYGSGTIEIANLLQFHRADYLAVTFADEGLVLRKAGISLPILVLNPEPESFEAMIEHNLEPEIYSFDILKRFSEAAKNFSVKSFPIHIKIDTGMKRLGFDILEIDLLIETLKQSKHLTIKSVFSHLAAADEKTYDDFTLSQISSFAKSSSKIVETFDYKILRHILNTAGIVRFPEANFDMIRLGIGLYGISNIYQDKLENVSTLKSHISQIKEVNAGESVGYGRQGKANKKLRIAIVPIGYADGLSRALSKGVGKVLINNEFAKIVGNICMDMCMVDISDIETQEGDEVIIFGEKFPIVEYAKALNTIPYEILTNVSERVKRVYYHE